MRRNISMMPLLIIGGTVNFPQSICQQDFGANDLEAKASAFVGQDLHVPPLPFVIEITAFLISDRGPPSISFIVRSPHNQMHYKIRLGAA